MVKSRIAYPWNSSYILILPTIHILDKRHISIIFEEGCRAKLEVNKLEVFFYPPGG